MSRPLRHALPLMLVLAAACGDATGAVALAGPSVRRTALSGGHRAAAGEFAETGAVVTTHGIVCAATLIAPSAVLTTASCAAQVGARSVFVPRARPLPLGHGPTYRVTRTVTHPGWREVDYEDTPLWLRLSEPRDAHEADVAAVASAACGVRTALAERAWIACLWSLPAATQQHLGIGDADLPADDIAVLFLDRPVSEAVPARLAEADDGVRVGDHVTAVGYGHNEHGRTWAGANQRRAGTVQVDVVGHYQLQLRPEDAGLAAGDIGAAIFADAPDGSPRHLVGVTSRITMDLPMAHPAHHATCTRLAAYLPWLAEVLSSQPTPAG